MSLTKTLKSINSTFDEVYTNDNYWTKYNYAFGNTSMGIDFSGIDSNHVRTKDMMILQWFLPQNQYSFIIELTSRKQFCINTWDLVKGTHTWNDDFIIEFDIERSYFDCLNMVYPMCTNLKFEHLSILKNIACQYMDKLEMKT